MPENKSDRYHAQPDEAYHQPDPLADDFAITGTQPPDDPDFEAAPPDRRRGRWRAAR